MALGLQSVNWQIASNRQAHHTDRFYGQDLLVRRGQLFQVSLTLSQGLSSGGRVTFTASTGTCSLLPAPLPHTHLEETLGVCIQGAVVVVVASGSNPDLPLT